MQHNGWDHGLKVTDDGAGLVGHCGGVLLRKLADQCGLTAALEGALARAGTFPQLSRGVVVVSMAVAIALGATSMSDVAVLAQLAPVLGAAPSGSTVRRALGLADTRTLGKIAQARARIRARVEADSRHAFRVPVAGHRREDPGGLAGHRPGRDADHHVQTCTWHRFLSHQSAC
jgi:hypothetical protein